jgi:hypothetical protein
MFATQSTVTNGCTDAHATVKTRSQVGTSPAVVGWGSSAVRKNWYLTAAGTSRAFGGFIGTLGPGTIGTIYSEDPGQTNAFDGMMSPWHHTQNMGKLFAGTAGGAISSEYPSSGNGGVDNCLFNTANNFDDFKYLPRTDLFGNDLLPANNYLPVTLVNPNPSGTATSTNQNNTTAGGTQYLQFDKNMTSTAKWTNFHHAALNATDNAAYRARTNGTIPATVFVIGLGGNTSSLGTPDYHLMQRWANDAECDQFNQPIDQATGCGSVYGAYTMPSAWSGQPQGTLVFSSNANNLRSAFLRISSQILRLAH